jgi:hypothetical protein
VRGSPSPHTVGLAFHLRVLQFERIDWLGSVATTYVVSPRGLLKPRIQYLRTPPVRDFSPDGFLLLRTPAACLLGLFVVT